MSGALCVLYIAIQAQGLLLHSRQESRFCAKKAKFYMNITSSLTILYTTFLGLFFNIIVQLHLYKRQTWCMLQHIMHLYYCYIACNIICVLHNVKGGHYFLTYISLHFLCCLHFLNFLILPLHAHMLVYIMCTQLLSSMCMCL